MYNTYYFVLSTSRSLSVPNLLNLISIKLQVVSYYIVSHAKRKKKKHLKQVNNDEILCVDLLMLWLDQS